MARKLSQSDPALEISFFLSGFYTRRSQLFAPFKGIGVNVVSFHDPVIDGANMEDTDLYEWQRRPGFSIFCPTSLPDTEVILDFDSFRNEAGAVISLFDSTARFAQFTNQAITAIIEKTTTTQGFAVTTGLNEIGTMMYYSDGASADFQKWVSSRPMSSINPSPWGITAPVQPPTISSQGCWLPFIEKSINNAILDPNGNVEVVTKTYGTSPLTGANEPNWPTTISSAINDGSIQWTNMGPLLSWLPDTYYPVPVIVLDTNGNLQLASAVSPAVNEWDSGTAYTVGIVVTFAGLYWASLVDNTGVAPNANYTVTTTTGDVATTQPYWVQTTSPSVTGVYPTAPYVPDWNQTVGGTTTDGNYVWTNLGPGVLVESYGTSYVFCYRTLYGHLSTASPISLNTGSIFGPQVATITSYEITGNVVTFQGANNFIPGNVFSVADLQIGTFLNNQSFIVLAAGLTPAQFSAVFDHADVGATVDSGATVNLIASLTGLGNTNPLCNATSNITATQVLDGVVTIYGPNNYVPGLFVTFINLVVATFLNDQQFEIVNVDPAGQWFQVYYTTPNGVVPPNQSQTTDSGTVTFNSVEIYRLSDGGGIYLFAGAVTNPNGGTVIIPYDSGYITAGSGADSGNPGNFVWTNPNNVTSPSAYATVTVPTPVTGGSSFQVLQICQAWEVGHAVTTQTATFPNPVVSGDSILVFVTIYNISGGFTVSDNMGNSYSQIATESLTMPNGAVANNYVMKATGVSSGPTTITLRFSGETTNTFSGFAAVECSGLIGTNGTPSVSSQLSGITQDPGSVTTGVANEVIFTFIWDNASTTHGSPSQPATLPTGYTSASNQILFDPIGDNFANTYQQQVVAYQVQTSADTYNPIWGTPANAQSIGISFAMPLVEYSPSDGLIASNFDFTVPQGIALSGIEIDFDGFFTGTIGDANFTVQLMRSGVPTGTTYTVTPTNTVQTFVVGGPGILWGTTWSAADLNQASWGVQIVANQIPGGTNATFSVRNVRARATGGTSTTGFVYNDFVTDEDLDELLIAPQNHLNDPPPGAPGSTVTTGGTKTIYWNGHVWMIVGNYIYFDAGPDCTNGNPPEAWPPTNRFQFSGPPINLEVMSDGLGLLVQLADRYNAILGGPETISFYPTDWLGNFGISSVNASFRDGSVIGQFTTQGQYFDLVGKDKQETGEHIADYLAANIAPNKAYVTIHRDGEDVGIFVSNGVDRILRFGSNIGAWSVPAFPVFGAGALRSIETSIGVYSLMLASPNGGISNLIGPITPASGTTSGAGVAWLNPENITDGSSSTYTTVSFSASGSSQNLIASDYGPLNLPPAAVVQGVEITVIGKQSGTGTLTITPTAGGGTSHTFSFGGSNTTLTFGGNGDLWGMPWSSPFGLTNEGPSFSIQASASISVPLPFDAGLATGAVGFAITQPLVVGPVVPSAASDFALLFTSSITTSESYQNIDAPAGWTQVTISTPAGPNVYSNSVSGSTTVDVKWGSGSTAIADAIASLILFQSSGSPSIVQKITGGSEITSGVNTRSFATNLTAGNTAVMCITTLSAGATGLVISNVTDSQGNSWVLLESHKNAEDAFVLTNQIWVYMAANVVGGADTVSFTSSGTPNTGLPWIAEISGLSSTSEFEVAEVQATVFYQNPGNYIYVRDLDSWGDAGTFGKNSGQPYTDCYITVGSITLAAPGGESFPLQHVVGYFDAAGSLGEGGSATRPNIFLLPNEIIPTTSATGWVQLPESQFEPPTGQNKPSNSLLSLRWPVNMANSDAMSQFVHHLQVKVLFQPENAPNTLKALSFKENQ